MNSNGNSFYILALIGLTSFPCLQAMETEFLQQAADKKNRDELNRALGMLVGCRPKLEKLQYIAEIQALIDKGAEINAVARPFFSWPPLIEAISSSNTDACLILIDSRADVNAKAFSNSTALVLAASFSLADVSLKLIACKAEVNAADSQNWTALLRATSNGLSDVSLLLMDEGANINAIGYAGYTALSYAASSGLTTVCRKLIDMGANINPCWSPLRLAACKGSAAICKMLIASNANITEKDYKGYTPLTNAAKNEHMVVCKVLLKNLLLRILVGNKPEALTQDRLRLKMVLLVLRTKLKFPHEIIYLILCCDAELKSALLNVLYDGYTKDKCISQTYWQMVKTYLPKTDFSALRKPMTEAFKECENDELKSLLDPEALPGNFEKIFLEN